MNDATTMRVEGFAQGRLIAPVSFQLRSAGPQDGQYDPRPRYPDGTLVGAGFKTGTNRGRPKGTGLGIGHTKETKAEMVERYKAGEGLHPLAAAYSTTTQRVREIVIQAGVEIRQAGHCRKEKEQRSSDVKLTKDDIREMVRLRDEGQSYNEIGKKFGVGQTTVIYHVGKAERGLKHDPKPRPVAAMATEPPHLVDLVADAAANPPDPAMDDPTPDAAANVQTEPATEAVVQQAWKEMQERTRQLRERVIAVHDLTTTPQRPYTPPAIIFDGVLSELVRPQNVTTVARTVVKLVEAMNAIPGVRADFGFSYELTAGVRS